MESRSSEEIEASMERLLRDLRAVVRDGEELLKAGTREFNDRGLAARERLAAALEIAKNTQRRLQERAVSGVKETHRMVQAYPYSAVGIGFGVGFLIGIITNRR